MNEAECREWLETGLGCDAAALDRLERYVRLLREESSRQNLVSKATLDDIWFRHIVDSAQLAHHLPDGCRTLLDIGSGAGLPGIVLACVSDCTIVLAEPRAKRAAFLRAVTGALGIAGRVSMFAGYIQRYSGSTFDAIAARAVAPTDVIIGWGKHLASDKTSWILPRGRNGCEELANSAHRSAFHVKRSVTDPASVILVGRLGEGP